jgi:hypothetical protein
MVKVNKVHENYNYLSICYRIIEFNFSSTATLKFLYFFMHAAPRKLITSNEWFFAIIFPFVGASFHVSFSINEYETFQWKWNLEQECKSQMTLLLFYYNISCKLNRASPRNECKWHLRVLCERFMWNMRWKLYSTHSELKRIRFVIQLKCYKIIMLLCCYRSSAQGGMLLTEHNTLVLQYNNNTQRDINWVKIIKFFLGIWFHPRLKIVVKLLLFF